MNSLPFIFPEEDLELNLILVLSIINQSSSTKKGNLVLTNERLTIYFYLIKNPNILNILLISLSRTGISLKSYEKLSFKSENNDLETLYSNKVLKFFLNVLLTKKLIQIDYVEKFGFVYFSTDEGLDLLNNFNDKYFLRVRSFLNKVKQINSIPLSRINKNLKVILNDEDYI